MRNLFIRDIDELNDITTDGQTLEEYFQRMEGTR